MLSRIFYLCGKLSIKFQRITTANTCPPFIELVERKLS